jgi:hypothetical protein
LSYEQIVLTITLFIVFFSIVKFIIIGVYNFFKNNYLSKNQSRISCLLLEDYFKNKIENYKKQDRSAKRKINKETYINVKWFLDNLGKQCIYCNEVLDYSVEDNKIVCNLTADRKNNNQPHDLDNIQPVCCHCNCSKSNREV